MKKPNYILRLLLRFIVQRLAIIRARILGMGL